MEARNLLDIMNLVGHLRDVMRHCYTPEGRRESVAEHCWRAALLAYFMKDEFQEVDISKVITMCLIHDLGEAFTGDIPTFDKTRDDESKEEKMLYNWVSSLPEPYAAEMLSLYKEMSALETTEAKLYKAIDGMEAVLAHNESDIATWIPHEYSLNQTYAEDKVQFSSYLMEVRQCLREDTQKKIEESEKIKKADENNSMQSSRRTDANV